MSRPPIYQDATLSGIIVTNGARVVAPSRRADGSLRKELKIRPGYTPEEDVARYRSTRAAEADARAGSKVGIPGAAPSTVQAAITGMSKSQKNREKKKEKKKEENEVAEEEVLEEPVAPVVEVPDSWDEGDEDTSPDAPVVPVVVPAPPPPVVEDPKRSLKSLQKKLRQAEQLKEKADGGQSILAEQQEKVDGIADLTAEIAKLLLDPAA